MKKLFFCALCLCTTILYADDYRSAALDLCLIIDGSSAVSNTKDEIVTWLSQTVIDGILQNNDKLTVWLVQKDAQIIFSDIIDANGKNRAKTALKAVTPSQTITNFDPALEAAVKREIDPNHIPYTLLVSGSISALSATLSGKQAGALRFSKTEDHRGWQSIVIATDITNRVQQAAASYMAGR
ncbi:MAG: hypothetical protein LBB43_04055 [Spirochaetaceae bacterium]|jgi:hypothetical protein|nr:hypothetical protein [Spirochaetaceae bacterium]